MSVQASTAPGRISRARRRSRAALRGAAVGALGLAVLTSLVGVAYAGSEATLAEGITVVGVDVGGLSPDAARTLLERRAAAVERVPIVFTAEGATLRVSSSQLGVRVDWASAIERAQARGAGAGPVRGLRRLWTRLVGAELSAPAGAYESVVAYTVKDFARRIDRPAREPFVRRVGLGVSVVDGLDGATLDQRAASELVVSALAGLDRGSPVPLPVVVRAPTLAADDLRPALARAQTALSAPIVLTAGPTRWRVARWELARILRLPSGGATELAVAGTGADRWIAGLQRLVNRAPRDATFRVRPGGIDVVPARDGRALDVGETAARVLRAATSNGDRIVSLPLATAVPERSTADAQAMGITGVVGSYTTTYGGTPGRLANVKLVAELIDGALVAPGATFSFNRTTGERTAAQGFQEAPVIINGELQNGIGGGVCQVSTTVFNAAFEAGLPIGTRTNHALYISHYPLGRDATVNFPDIDLTFSNDTGHWLLLRAFVGAGSLTVNLYGTPQGRRVESVAVPLTVTGKIPVERTPDPTLAKGRRVIDEIGVPPRETRVTRRVYDADGTLLSESSWASSYRGEPRQVRVGTKPTTEQRVGEPPVGDAPPGEDSATSSTAPGRVAGTVSPAAAPAARP